MRCSSYARNFSPGSIEIHGNPEYNQGGMLKKRTSLFSFSFRFHLFGFILRRKVIQSDSEIIINNHKHS